jgi:hypothetical protein
MSLVYGMAGVCPLCGKEHSEADATPENLGFNHTLDCRTGEKEFACLGCGFMYASDLEEVDGKPFWIETCRYPIDETGSVRRPPRPALQSR